MNNNCFAETSFSKFANLLNH